jgi:hypothetical protein
MGDVIEQSRNEMPRKTKLRKRMRCLVAQIGYFARDIKWLLVFLFAFCFHFKSVQAEECYEFLEPIDVVYLWVDGNDPQWKEIKNHYKALIEGKSDITQDGATDNRFADNQELRYSLRSIWKFAPFINHIYIVTMNQRPAWLADHPMITVVDHKEIFFDPRVLPTFNSQAIESNLHRIPHLKEHFIYFNDDVFLGKSVTPLDFFTQFNEVKVLFEESLSPSGPSTDLETTYRRAWRNTNALFDQYYQPEPRYRLCHAPFALRKSYIAATEQEFPFVFALNASHKFRSIYDYNLTNGLLQYHWLYHNKVVEGDMTNKMITLRNDASFRRTKRALDALLAKPVHTFCLEDNMMGESEKTIQLLHEFLEAYYPDPAPWEIIQE